MNAKLRSIPAIAADVFLFWGIVYATATANEAEALPLLALFGAALVCAFVAWAVRMGDNRNG